MNKVSSANTSYNWQSCVSERQRLFIVYTLSNVLYIACGRCLAKEPHFPVSRVEKHGHMTKTGQWDVSRMVWRGFRKDHPKRDGLSWRCVLDTACFFLPRKRTWLPKLKQLPVIRGKGRENCRGLGLDILKPVNLHQRLPTHGLFIMMKNKPLCGLSHSDSAIWLQSCIYLFIFSSPWNVIPQGHRLCSSLCIIPGMSHALGKNLLTLNEGGQFTYRYSLQASKS